MLDLRKVFSVTDFLRNHRERIARLQDSRKLVALTVKAGLVATKGSGILLRDYSQAHLRSFHQISNGMDGRTDPASCLTSILVCSRRRSRPTALRRRACSCRS